jgi:hypothetical protein
MREVDSKIKYQNKWVVVRALLSIANQLQNHLNLAK